VKSCAFSGAADRRRPPPSRSAHPPRHRRLHCDRGLLFAGEPLVPLEDGLFRLGEDPTGIERVRFSDVVDGRAMRLFFSETEFRRVDE
jgi:hypothetical protein